MNELAPLALGTRIYIFQIHEISAYGKGFELHILERYLAEENRLS